MLLINHLSRMVFFSYSELFIQYLTTLSVDRINNWKQQKEAVVPLSQLFVPACTIVIQLINVGYMFRLIT